MVAIPLEQGRFFNGGKAYFSAPWDCRNPFGAGTVFQSGVRIAQREECESQSLWSRDGFSMDTLTYCEGEGQVAIPLEQGRFFNTQAHRIRPVCRCRNPFGAGTVFQCLR